MNILQALFKKPEKTNVALRKRQILFLISFISYLVIIIFNRFLYGTWRGEVLFIPILSAGLLFGFRPALFICPLLMVFNFIFPTFLGIDSRETVLSVGGIIGSGALVIIGCVFGYVRDLSVNLRRELEWRKEAENELSKYRNELEELVKKKTSELTEHIAQLKERDRELSVANQQLLSSEKKAKEAKDFLENIFQTTTDGILVTDSKGFIIRVNSAVENMLGYCEDELIGRQTVEFSPKDEKYIQKVTHMIEQLLDSGTVSNSEVKWVRKDRTVFTSEVNMIRLKDYEGNQVGSVASIRDITERKRAEEELAKLATAIKQAHETVMILGTDGIITYVNPALEEQMGYSSSELIDTNLISLDRSTDQQHLFQKAWKTINQGKIWSGHMNPISKDGSILEFDVTISPIRDSSGKITSFVSIARNVTKVIEMEERLRRAETMEALGTLAGGVAHDLNNVLGAIVGYPDLLLKDIPEDSPMRRSIMAIRRSGERASAIVQDLLTLARRGVQVTEVVNLNTVLTKCLESVEYKKLEELHPDVELETNLEKDLLNILGSPVHLSKTAINLLSNAVEAMPGGGKITISSENRYLDKPIKGYDSIKEGDYVILSVKDNGIGIANEDLDKIFEPFYTKKVMGRSGTGLGMAVVWGTLKDHRGYIDVKSIEGQGTTFTLYFPVTRKEIEDIKEPVSIEEYSGNGEKILVVDDAEAQRDVATNLLQELNYTVETVVSGEEALEYMKSNTADLLLLDMIMDPGIDGLDTYKGIIEMHPGQKAIIASGFSETDRVRETQKLGAGAYIRKPYTLEKIGLAVKTELGRKT
jgi:PAS domain S-box-containing protein